MRSTASALAITLLFLVAPVIQASEGVVRLLPTTVQEAEASYLGGDPEAERIAQEFQAAIQTNRAWFDSYLADLNLQPGEVLPYHSNYGVTEAEYEYLISNVERMTLVPIGSVTVTVEGSPNLRKVSIVGERLRLSFLLDLSSNTIRTNRGVLNEHTIIDQNNENTPLGAWEGEQWAVTEESSGFSEKIAIGKMDNKNSAIIYYDIKLPDEGVVSHFVIVYPR